MQWNDGYVSDIPYTSGAYRAMSPHHIAVACILNGVEPVLPDRPFTYFELGCGRGLTSNILAAAHPQGRFYANDFLPAHVAEATALAGEARLDNLTVFNATFAELAQDEYDIPPLDFVTLHGVYSWISEANRRHIVEFIRKYLRPGGMVYVSYNALPGWAGAAPLQRLLLELAGSAPGDSTTRLREAHTFVRRLVGCGARYFVDTPGLQIRLDSLEKDSPAYVAHEYLNRCWQPMYHCDVARDLAQANLEFAGPALLNRALWRHALPPDQHAVVSACPDPALRETVMDYVLGTCFRCDIFVRGAHRLSSTRQRALLDQAGIALLVPRAAVTALPGANAETPILVAEQLLDVLAQGPCELAKLTSLPAFRGEYDLLARVSALLSFSQEAALYWPPARPVDGSAARRLNRAIARAACDGTEHPCLASPVIGSAVDLDLPSRLAYLSLSDAGHTPSAAELAHQVDVTLRRTGQQAQSGCTSMEELTSRMRVVLRERAPLWRELGVL